MNRILPKENMLWEFLVNNYETKDLKKNLNSMSFNEISNFLTDCDKLASDIIRDKNLMFEKEAVPIIIQIRKLAMKYGRKKMNEALKN